MSTFDKIELAFIIIELISIFVEIGLQIYEIKSSEKMEQNILQKLNK